MLHGMRSRHRTRRADRPPVGRVLRHVLAVWLLFCGCEWTAIVRVAIATDSGCSSTTGAPEACCCCRASGAEHSAAADRDVDSEPGSDDRNDPCCVGDCCMKLAEPRTIAPTPVDEIGVAIVPWLARGRDAVIATQRRAPRARRHGPPTATPPKPGRRILLETARMRIAGGRRVA